MEHMGAFAEVFGYTPDQYRALSFTDYERLLRYLEERNRRMRG